MFVRASEYLIPEREFTPLGGESVNLKPLVNGVTGGPHPVPTLIFCAMFNDTYDKASVRDVTTQYLYDLPGASPYTTAPGPFGGLYYTPKASGGVALGKFALPTNAGTIIAIAKFIGGPTDLPTNILVDKPHTFGIVDPHPETFLRCTLPLVSGPGPFGVAFVVGPTSSGYGQRDAAIYLAEGNIFGTWHHYAFTWKKATPVADDIWILPVDPANIFNHVSLLPGCTVVALGGTPPHWQVTAPAVHSQGKLKIYEDGIQRVPLIVEMLDFGWGYGLGSDGGPFPGTPPGVVGLPGATAIMDDVGAGFSPWVWGVVGIQVPAASLVGYGGDQSITIDPPAVGEGTLVRGLPARRAYARAYLPNCISGRINDSSVMDVRAMDSLGAGTHYDSLWIFDVEFSGAAVANHMANPYGAFIPYGIPIRVHIEPAEGGRVQEVVVDDPGSGYTMPPSVSFSGGWGTETRGTSMPSAHAVMSGDGVQSIEIDDGGWGFNVAPSVSISGDGSGAKATAKLARTIERVEFYANKKRIGVSVVPPFDFIWPDPDPTPRTGGCVPPDRNFDTLEARLVCTERSFDSAPVQITVR